MERIECAERTETLEPATTAGLSGRGTSAGGGSGVPASDGGTATTVTGLSASDIDEVWGEGGGCIQETCQGARKCSNMSLQMLVEKVKTYSVAAVHTAHGDDLHVSRGSLHFTTTLLV